MTEMIFYQPAIYFYLFAVKKNCDTEKKSLEYFGESKSLWVVVCILKSLR